MDVGGWLRGLGLGQYEEKFRDNKIDADLLPRLTVDDLKDIGVSVVGDRRRLLDAIAILAGTSPPAEVPAPAMKSAPAQSLQASAERRHLAVLFCDLVGSTGISAALDAEDWRNLVGGYLDAASEAVAQLGGHVAKKLGDGIMAVFGHPVAQENDSERAVRSALAIQRALAELNRKGQASGAPELVARIGIATGAVVVDSAGEIFGDAPNIAARVQALAEPGTVLVAARVQRQVAGLFVVEDRGSHALKGVAEPTTLFRITRASGGGRRSGQRALTPLVGRDEEVTMLLRRWERARQGEGQFVQIVGEPGLGKSRLIEEFHARLREIPHTWVEWSSSQLLQNTPLHPIAEWGRQRFGGADVTPERRLADLETSLAQVKLDPEEYVPLLAPLVDIPLPPERVANFAPEELRRRQMAALNAWVTAGARTQPVVLAFEDLHWADPTTLDVLRGFGERGALAPLLVVATTRPEFRAPWGARSHHGAITLAPLDRGQVRQMVGALAERHALSGEVIEGVGERTGGVPLFIEEVTRLILERGGQGGAQAIPPTLQQSLAARLDRLGPAREVAMIGAVLGRGFSFSLLRAVAGMDDAPLHGALEKLAEADILLVEGLPPEAEYRFKHALIQDAAYENLLKSRRQALHRRAAEILRAQPERAAAEPEVIAHHFTQAGLNDLAIEWWGRAGDQALRRSAFQEAIAHLGKAIAMADGVTKHETAPPALRLRLQLSLSSAVMQAHGHYAPEVRATFLRARELAAAVDDPLERLAAFYGLWVGNYMRGEGEAMGEIAEAMIAEAEQRPSSSLACVAHRVSGVTCWMARGDFAAARTHLERAVASHDFERDRELAFRFGQDIGVVSKDYLALILCALGEFGRARAMIEDAVALAVLTGHAPSLAHAYCHLAIFEFMRLDAARARLAAESCLALGREHKLALWLLIGGVVHAWATAAANNTETGWSRLSCSIEDCGKQGQKAVAVWFYPRLALAEAEAGQLERALRTIETAIVEQAGQHFWDSEAHRVRGQILLQRDFAGAANAEESFLTAVAIAKQQGARSFGLRAALSLAKLYQSTGRPVEAHDALAPALEGFAPTPEMPEIAEAMSLAARLA